MSASPRDPPLPIGANREKRVASVARGSSVDSSGHFGFEAAFRRLGSGIQGSAGAKDAATKTSTNLPPRSRGSFRARRVSAAGSVRASLSHLRRGGNRRPSFFHPSLLLRRRSPRWRWGCAAELSPGRLRAPNRGFRTFGGRGARSGSSVRCVGTSRRGQCEHDERMDVRSARDGPCGERSAWVARPSGPGCAFRCRTLRG